MIRGIIFDCFGVLHQDANTAYFSRFPALSGELHDLNVRADHGFLDKAAYLREASAITGVKSEEILAGIARENTLNRLLVNYIINQLRPHYKIGMLSNIGRGWLKDFFNANQLHDLFDAVVLPNEEGITKPDPRVFEHVAAKLGLEPAECIMIDDRIENCKGAEEAGMKSILYTSNEVLYSDLAKLLQR